MPTVFLCLSMYWITCRTLATPPPINETSIALHCQSRIYSRKITIRKRVSFSVCVRPAGVSTIKLWSSRMCTGWEMLRPASVSGEPRTSERQTTTSNSSVQSSSITGLQGAEEETEFSDLNLPYAWGWNTGLTALCNARSTQHGSSPTTKDKVVWPTLTTGH